ncbi:hypothetical protein SK128_018669 [Halocaridina rubra]|uniref:RING-type domain-containing protein n=1 Tax=Halocaridina rubra TaxID=373956 RepID=A0AAN9AH97_HALRR
MATYCPGVDGDREPFSCPICFEDYDLADSRRAPKLLMCLHTFCFECTQKLCKVDGSLECSMCRMLHERVSLDDLFDNYVIVQHLIQEREEQDLEFARKIDQELRNELRLEPEAINISEEHSDIANDTINLDDIEHIEPDETSEIAAEDNASITNVDDVSIENERNECQPVSVFRSLNLSSDSSSEDGDDDVIGDDIDEDIGNDQEVAIVDDSSEVSDGNEELETEFFTLPSFPCVLQQDKEEDVSNEDINIEVEGDDSQEEIFDENVDLTQEEIFNENEHLTQEEIFNEDNNADESIFENLPFLIGSLPDPFNVDNEEEDDDDDDDDDRYHSACDEISSSHWAGHDLLISEGSENEDEDSISFSWQMLSPEPVSDD